MADLSLGSLWDADLAAQRAALQEVLIAAQGTHLPTERMISTSACPSSHSLLCSSLTHPIVSPTITDSSSSLAVSSRPCPMTGEMALEVFLKQVREHWVVCELEMATYRSRVRLIKGWDVSNCGHAHIHHTKDVL